MKRISFLVPCIVFVAMSCGVHGQANLNAKKATHLQSPNVILILMDDMGYGDLECYGGGPYHTPNLNKLAADGMRFTNFNAAQATCSASRSAYLTGCYPNRIGVSGAFSPDNK